MSAPPDSELPPNITVASRMATFFRGGGILAPLITILVAFLAGGLVVLATGHNPIETYQAIFKGSGFNWFFPWLSEDDRIIAALNLQQTLILTTPLILTGLAVAFAFRCGLFNIGGQGQYILGSIFAVWVGSSFDGMPALLHVLVAMLAGVLAGAVWAGIAGLLKALAGTNEVISTIMLNWIAIWTGVWIFNLGSPLQNDNPDQVDVPVSNDIVEGAKLPVFWGDPQLQGLHIGIFIALAALVVFWVLLNRTTLGYEVRAVGFNPDAAEASGINVRRNYVMVMAICGAFAGLGGALDLLGWQFRIATNDIQTHTLAFFGIAVALLGRNTAIGTLLGALLFAGLLTGTSVRNLDPTVFEPQLATNLTYMIQGLVVLLISTDVLVVYLLRRRRRK
ncbi:ABC transporter permease [Solirubrobacter sp. CPCC 204708]|uniref:ABC transporter permease n=1 Tax=Solirubrobacter deserti TaxID=2282478 RepID=A0ABT4RTM4_9ACTN|nr:ABC transporter permease [Solirubrobacter deserti]MBE2318325.1 ABC transporter permease [Solirubrobacter deserti]MDA0141924.1 ABC transporter permease [Solirubrobacter deserti]